MTDASAPSGPRLVVLDGPHQGRALSLASVPATLGRDPGSDLPLPGDRRISRVHCRFTAEGAALLVEDLGSSNGTWVKGRRLEEPAALHPGDLLQVGNTRLRYLAATEGGTQPPEVAASPVNAPTRPVLSNREVMVTGVLDPRTLEVPEGEDSETGSRRRLELVQKVSKTLAGKLAMRELFEAAADSILEALPAERLYVLKIPEEGEVEVVVRRCRTPGKEQLSFSRTILERALRENVAVLLHDALSDDQLKGRQSIAMASIRSAMCVPVMHAGEVKAVIHMDATAARAFTEKDLEVVSIIANQAGLALANSELYEDLAQAYRDLQEAQERLVQSEKLSTIGTLAASLAHDMGNVITPIQTISSRALESAELDPKLREIFERQIGRLKALTTQLLSFSRQQPPTRVATDINAALEEAVSLVRTEARHSGVEIALDTREDLPRALADANRLDQVFINLLVNAFHAMEETGGGELRVSTFLEDGRVAVAIRDTGPGIPADVLERIFEPFYSTKGDKGTGLGLYSCRRIVEEEHEGTLRVETELGKGTTFTILLPRTDS